jgi:hypothetical protein
VNIAVSPVSREPEFGNVHHHEAVAWALVIAEVLDVDVVVFFRPKNSFCRLLASTFYRREPC